MMEALAVLLFWLSTLAMPSSVRAAWGKEIRAAFLATYRRRPGLRFVLRASADAVRAARGPRRGGQAWHGCGRTNLWWPSRWSSGG